MLDAARRNQTGRVAGLALAAVLLAALCAPPAQAAEGYELDAAEPVHELDGAPRGLAVDQASQELYVAISSTNPLAAAPGQIDRFDSSLAAEEVFAEGGGYYTGVGVNPLTHDFYGLQVELRNLLGNFGTSRVDLFSSAGASAGSFAVSYPYALPPIATDSAGRIFYPNPEADSVQVFSSAGTLLEEVTCGGCPGGPIGFPVSVALDAGDNLYIVDLGPDRVIKMTRSEGGPYAFASILQSGRRAAAVAVDPASGDVLVGDLPSERNYHIVAYNAAGVQFDDFGAGLFPDPSPELGAVGAYQMAINATTHELFVGHVEKFVVFEKDVIAPPTVTTEDASAVTQLGATLNASVNANGHAALACEFEYVDDGEFQLHGFVNATELPCGDLPDGYADTAISQTVAGLLPDTTYHYQVTATNNAGSVTGSAATFATLAEVAPTVPTADDDVEPVPADTSQPDPVPGSNDGSSVAPVLSIAPVASPRRRRCRKGFRRKRVKGKVRCVKVCRKGFRRKRVKGKVRCVRRKRSARHRHRHHGH